MKNKETLLAELTLMQEAAQNAQKNGLDVVAFHTKCIAEFAEAAKAALEDSSERPPLDKGNFRVTIEDGGDGSVQVVDTYALKFFYLDQNNDGNPSLKDYLKNGSETDECLFYFVMREYSSKKNKASAGKFEDLYQKYLKEFDFEEILQGDE